MFSATVLCANYLRTNWNWPMIVAHRWFVITNWSDCCQWSFLRAISPMQLTLHAQHLWRRWLFTQKLCHTLLGFIVSSVLIYLQMRMGNQRQSYRLLHHFKVQYALHTLNQVPCWFTYSFQDQCPDQHRRDQRHRSQVRLVPFMCRYQRWQSALSRGYFCLASIWIEWYLCWVLSRASKPTVDVMNIPCMPLLYRNACHCCYLWQALRQNV